MMPMKDIVVEEVVFSGRVGSGVGEIILETYDKFLELLSRNRQVKASVNCNGVVVTFEMEKTP